MAKRTGNSSVNSSIRAGTNVQETGFTQLLELQKISNEHLGSIADAISIDSKKLSALATLDALAVAEQKKVDKTIVEENTTLHEIEKGQKELIELAKKDSERSARDAAAITSIAQSMKTFKTLGEKLGDMKKGFGEKYGKGNIGRTALSAVNVGGLLDKKIAQGDFIKQQKELGSTKTDKELKADFTKAHKTSKAIKENEEALTKHKKIAGGAAGALTDEQITSSTDNTKGKELLKKRAELSSEYAKHDLRTQVETPTAVAKKDLSKKRDKQIPIPIKVEPAKKPSAEVAKKDLADKRKKPNTVPMEQPSIGVDTGMLGTLSAGIGSMGDALAKLGKGAGDGLQGVLEGLAKGFAALCNPQTLLGMGAFTLVAMGIGKALEMAAPAIAAFAPVLMKVAEVIGGVFIEAIKAIPEILKSIGDVIVNVVKSISDAITGIMDSIVTSIERLAAVDGSNLLAVGAGLVAVGAGMAAFGAGGAVAGVANLVTGFLGAVTGQKTPIEQLEQIANLGPGLSQAGIGIEKLSAGLASFSSTNGSKVVGMSEQTAAMKDRATGVSNIVSAPTVNNSVKQTSVAKITSTVRTQESSVDRYFGGRAVY